MSSREGALPIQKSRSLSGRSASRRRCLTAQTRASLSNRQVPAVGFPARRGRHHPRAGRWFHRRTVQTGPPWPASIGTRTQPSRAHRSPEGGATPPGRRMERCDSLARLQRACTRRQRADGPRARAPASPHAPGRPRTSSRCGRRRQRSRPTARLAGPLMKTAPAMLPRSPRQVRGPFLSSSFLSVVSGPLSVVSGSRSDVGLVVFCTESGDH